jgi:hypothetical protein
MFPKSYTSYNQYLGSQRCCNISYMGPTGPIGPTGPGLIGPRGDTGPTGPPNGPTGPTGPSPFDASGNLDLSCNLIQDVSGIYFCDGTYIGQGNSFDISSNQLIEILSSENIIIDPSNTLIVNGDLDMNTNRIFFNNNVVNIGTNANATAQFSIGIGSSVNPGNQSVAVGALAAQTGNADDTISIGRRAGNSTQNAYAIAIGYLAGTNNQGQNAIAIGERAGSSSQGAYSVAIGRYAGRNNIGSNSIIMNGTNANLDRTTTSAFFVAPVRNVSGNNILQYNSSTNEISYSNTLSTSGNITIDPSNTLIVNGNLDLSCNIIEDVSGIYFCDGTYIGQGSSFDITTNQELDITSNNNINFSSSNINVNNGNLYLNNNNNLIVNNPSNDINTISSYYQNMVNGSSFNQIEINNDALQQWIKLIDGPTNGYSNLTYQLLEFNDNAGSVMIYKNNEILYNDVSILPRRFYQTDAFSVLGSPSNTIYNTGTIKDMVANSKWKIEVGFRADTYNSESVITYQVLDSLNSDVTTESALSFIDETYMTPNPINPRTPSGSWVSFVDEFVVNKSAIESCSFQITGGTYDNSNWDGKYKVTITLTYLSKP